MAGMLRVPRSRGALTGLLLVLLGAWGALVPFAGPYFHYAYTPDAAWTYTTGRLWLEILPGAAAALGGLLLLAATLRPVALFGGMLGAVAGAWFAVGTLVAPLWAATMVTTAGQPVGGTALRAAEQLGFFQGLGVVIVFIAALGLGRVSAVTVRDTLHAENRAAALAAEDETAPHEVSPGQTMPGGSTGTVPSPRQPA